MCVHESVMLRWHTIPTDEIKTKIRMLHNTFMVSFFLGSSAVYNFIYFEM